MAVSSPPPTAYVTTLDYGRALRRGWWLIAAGLVLGLVFAALALVLVPKTYTSTASVLVNSTGDTAQVANGRTSTPVNLDTEAQLVKSSVVAAKAQDELDDDQPIRQLVRQVNVSVPPNSAVLNIGFSDRSPEQAAAGAQAFADAYLENRQDLTDLAIESHDEAIREQMAPVTEQLRDVSDQLAGLPETSPQRPVQLAEQAQLRQRLEALNAQLGSQGIVGGNVGDVITAPVVPSSASAPDPRILGASGLLLGLVLGLLAALIKDRRDRRVFGRRELEQLGLDVLVPVLDLPSDGSIVPSTSSRFDVDAIRMLRNSSLAQLRNHRGALLIAPISDEAVTESLAINLAAAVARTGSTCVAVSANSGAPTAALHETGLADVLLGKVGLDRAMKASDEPGLRLLGPGADGQLTPELLQGSRVSEVFTEMSNLNMVVVSNVASTCENADAQSLAPLFDGVVLVAVERLTTTDEVQQAIEQFEHVSARILGAVIVNRDSLGTRAESGHFRRLTRRQER